VYTQTGPYQVSLTVIDTEGLKNTVTHTLVVSKQITSGLPPTAEIRAPAIAIVNYPVILDAGGSTDPDGLLAQYVWNLGDGTVAQGQTITHTYAATGSYNTSLIVIDDTGLSDKAWHTVEITAVQPISPSLPAIDIIGPSAAQPYHDVEFAAEWRDNSDHGMVSLVWDFGDNDTAIGQRVLHFYEMPGTYEIKLTAVGTDTVIATAMHTITVSSNEQNNQSTP
jgi:PKD repeat protein